MDAAMPLLQKETEAVRPKAGQICPTFGARQKGPIMKHPSSRAFYTYWDDKRGVERAPDRSDFEPAPLREQLGDIFVLSYDPEAGHRFRVAGTRVCALLGRDIKGEEFPALFAEDSRREIADVVTIVAEELLPIVAGVTANTEDGAKVPLELLLLPFSSRAHTSLSLTGLLAPLGNEHSKFSDFNLISWRVLSHPPRRFHPRELRKWSMARGFMVYEGWR
jgi:hypothetical protein